jgi:hypothetical protein
VNIYQNINRPERISVAHMRCLTPGPTEWIQAVQEWGQHHDMKPGINCVFPQFQSFGIEEILTQMSTENQLNPGWLVGHSGQYSYPTFWSNASFFNPNHVLWALGLVNQGLALTCWKAKTSIWFTVDNPKAPYGQHPPMGTLMELPQVVHDVTSATYII